MIRSVLLISAMAMAGCSVRGSKAAAHGFGGPDAYRDQTAEEYIGKSKKELGGVFGDEASGQVHLDVWELWDDLAPGTYSSVWVTEITFRDGIAIGVERYRKAVGCIHVK